MWAEIEPGRKHSLQLQEVAALADRLRLSGRTFGGMLAYPRRLMMRAELHAHVDPESLCRSVRDALGRARELLEGDQTAA